MNNIITPTFAQDRADHIAATVVHIVTDSLSRWLHGKAVCLADIQAYAAAYVRDEIADIEREIIGTFPRTD